MTFVLDDEIDDMNHFDNTVSYVSCYDDDDDGVVVAKVSGIKRSDTISPNCSEVPGEQFQQTRRGREFASKLVCQKLACRSCCADVVVRYKSTDERCRRGVAVNDSKRYRWTAREK